MATTYFRMPAKKIWTSKGVFYNPVIVYNNDAYNQYLAQSHSYLGWYIPSSNTNTGTNYVIGFDSPNNPLWLRHNGTVTPTYANLPNQTTPGDSNFVNICTFNNGWTLCAYRYAGDRLVVGIKDENSNVISVTDYPNIYTSSTTIYKNAFITYITKIDDPDTFMFMQLYEGYSADGTRHVDIGFTSLGSTQWSSGLSPLVGDDPYSTIENETPAGGYGGFDYSGDDDIPPSLPTLSAAQVGFVSLWNPSQQEMKDLASYLWTGTFDLTNFKKLFTDPMECILSVGIVPVTPTTGTATEIVFGGSSHSGVNAKPITSQFVTVDLGKVHINGQSASALDYSPYVKVSIFLPYCGTYALDADDVMDADIELEYHIDIYTGACVAYLTITKTNSDGSTLHSTLYQFTGNCLASIPITGNDHSQFIQSMLFMGAAVAATVATSGAGAPAIEGAAATGDVAGASAVNAVTASSAVNSVMSMKPNVLRSGNLSSTAGLLGKQRPCITVTWPNLCRPDTEYKLLGMPVHKSGTLSDFEGFTIVSAVHVENILCTEIEKQMIEQMLYKGVMV